MKDDFDATDLNIHLTANRQAGTNIYCYYKVLSQFDADTFDNRPWVEDGDWVQTGDLIADAAGCSHGDLALGRNLIIANTVKGAGVSFIENQYSGENKHDSLTSVMSAKIIKNHEAKNYI